ncbi:MAG TPA: DNA translocase FtsK 4TM domain-containing protein [Candidatus Limnocylindria bacterium]|nr:DNA translocase FtsK 4TM domain-containing protein [Candidatus Limnocylindria bacterium]
MARKTAVRKSSGRREAGAGARMRAEVRDHIIGVALGLFGLLSIVALFSSQGSVLEWWRSVMTGLLGWGAGLVPLAFFVAAAIVWRRALARQLLLPGVGVALVILALLGIVDIASGNGGWLGRTIGTASTNALGNVGGMIVLLAVFAIGVVVAANRTLQELARPALDRRPQFAFRPGTVIPGGSAPQFGQSGTALRVRPEPASPAPAEPQEIKINMDQERPARKPVKPAAQQEVLPIAPEPIAPLTGALAGLPSAMLVAEGVMHADPPDVPWQLPPLDLLEEGSAARSGKDEVMRNTRVIEETLSHFNIQAKVVEVSVGPVVTRYELKPAAGVKLSRIESLDSDLALALAARTLRIEAPVPGKSVVGIEVPNLAIGMVTLKDVAETAMFKDASSKLTVALGRDVSGSPIVADLAKLPHLLIAGQTGSGKSVSINSIICSLLMSATPDDVRLILADPKRVELAGFNNIPHLVVPVVTDHAKILNALYWAVGEMDRRYRLFARATARNIDAYNAVRSGPDRVPYIVLIVDELADLMMSAPIQVEKAITRLAQLARATGIHLVVATQRPSVDVITGLIKANIPARIAFATASAIDSRTILDMSGAEKLLGRGDMLVLPPDVPKPIRAQGVFVSDREIEAVTRHWKLQRDPHYRLEILEDQDRAKQREDGGDSDIEDDRYEEAVEIVRRAGQASVSMLQRKMTIGFARAGRLIDIMEQEGVIGPSVGPGKMRQVYGARSSAGGGDEA